ncbi:hypothetical protein J6590_064598 [Homalodisca vitripennis]|nr:hypothetical protein J6590_064598 [Homalodisca vitripennis]
MSIDVFLPPAYSRLHIGSVSRSRGGSCSGYSPLSVDSLPSCRGSGRWRAHPLDAQYLRFVICITMNKRVHKINYTGESGG